MGRIWTSRGELAEALTELVGFKTGLVLTREELIAHVPDGAELLREGEESDVLRLRGEEYEGLARTLLHAVGGARKPGMNFAVIDLMLEYQDDPLATAVLSDAMESLFRCARLANGQPIDVTPMVAEAKAKHGDKGLLIAMKLVENLTEHVMSSPWSRMRRVEWDDKVELQSLFDEAGLSPSYGTFFDQRFIDYLAQKFSAIDRIHWRKFEGLTCEFFARLGCTVAIGPGSNDDNVDARVWWPDDDASKPAALLVQCKREKAAVGKVVVKALYADIVDEGASGGLVVTSQRLSPGADAVRIARQYPVGAADRKTLRLWIRAMRHGKPLSAV